MYKALATYGVTAGVFALVDLIWLGLVAKSFYRGHIGGLLLDQPRLAPAIVFYLLYPVGLTLFAILPNADERIMRAAIWGGAFGFFAYATYDLTNLATLKTWPVELALVDICWGVALSAMASVAGRWIAGHFA